MAIKEPFMVRTSHAGSHTGAQTVEAETGQSILIKGIGVGVKPTNEFVEALIGRLSVGYFRTGIINTDNHLEECKIALWFSNLHDYLVEKGIFKGYPIAEGETFSLAAVTADVDLFTRIVYELYDAGDITKDMPNGTESTEFSFINYGTNTDDIAVSTYGDIDYSLNPKEYPSFPYGVEVPPNKEIDVHGILIKSWGGRLDHTAAEMRFLRLMRDRQVLFDEDRVGVFCTQGLDYFAYHTRQARHPVVLFPTPITFKAGEELKVELSCGDDTAITAKDVVFALVETVRTVA